MTGKNEAKEQKKNLQPLVTITPNNQANPLKKLYLKTFITYSLKFGLQTRM
jgi:predicted ABC-type exoprotein transport system permease subunit